MSALSTERQERPLNQHPSVRFAFPSPDAVHPPVLSRETTTVVRYDLFQPAVQMIALLEQETDLDVALRPILLKSGKPSTHANFWGTGLAREKYYSVLDGLNTTNDIYRALRRAHEGSMLPTHLLPPKFTELTHEEQLEVRNNNPEIAIREQAERFIQALFAHRYGNTTHESSPPRITDLRDVLRSIAQPVLERQGISFLNPHPPAVVA